MLKEGADAHENVHVPSGRVGHGLENWFEKPVFLCF